MMFVVCQPERKEDMIEWCFSHLTKPATYHSSRLFYDRNTIRKARIYKHWTPLLNEIMIDLDHLGIRPHIIEFDNLTDQLMFVVRWGGICADSLETAQEQAWDFLVDIRFKPRV